MGSSQSVPDRAAGESVARPAACTAAAASRQTPQDEASSSSSSCPVPERYRKPAVYNVYGQRIDGGSNPLAAAAPAGDLLDPKNNMPLEPNQQPCPGQRRPLSTERIQSNIPKGGTDSTWLYPSPQMFFNGALFVLLSGVLTAASGGGAAAKRLLALATHHHPPPTKIHQHKPLLPSPEAQGQGQRRERGADGLGRARAQQ